MLFSLGILKGDNMKNTILFIAILFLAGIANAGDKAVLTKTYTSGFVPPELSQSERCEIFEDKIVITKASAGLTSVKKQKISLSGDIYSTISKAAQGEIVKDVETIDAPTTEYTALGSSIRLQAKGSGEYRNTAPEAQTLVLFIDQNCN